MKKAVLEIPRIAAKGAHPSNVWNSEIVGPKVLPPEEKKNLKDPPPGWEKFDYILYQWPTLASILIVLPFILTRWRSFFKGQNVGPISSDVKNLGG